MGHRYFFLSIAVGLAIALHSCREGQPNKAAGDTGKLGNAGISQCRHTAIKHAEGFSVKNMGAYKEAVVYDPWNKPKIFQKYYLVPRENKLPANIPPDVTVVRTPVESIAALSNTQVGILKFLGLQNRVVAVSYPNQIYDGELSGRIREGTILGVGDMYRIDFEKILELSPEIEMVSGFMAKSPQQKKLVEAGLPVVYNLDWMEGSPLARAEWAKFIAAFFDKEEQAKKLFDGLEQRYDHAKSLVDHLEKGPSVISGYQYQGVWHMPGGRSYLGQILRDAKGDYCWLSDSTQGSISLSYEVVYEKQADAKIWLGPAQCRSLKQLGDMDGRYALFEAFKTENVFCPTRRMNANGANDWWESGIMKPDLVLKDIMKILHPGALPGHELYFYQKLE